MYLVRGINKELNQLRVQKYLKRGKIERFGSNFPGPPLTFCAHGMRGTAALLGRI